METHVYGLKSMTIQVHKPTIRLCWL